MFIAMNHFHVADGREAEFEQRWRERDSYLAKVPGFVHFMLLRGNEPGDYASHTVWQDRAAFDAWARSEAFVAAHRAGTTAGLLDGPPQVRVYDAVLSEGNSGGIIGA